MQKLPFPEVKSSQDFQIAFNELLREVHKENVYKTIPPRNVQKFSHGTGWRTHSGDESAKELSEMELHTSEQSVKFKDIIQHNLSVLPMLLQCITNDMHSQLMGTMYSKILQSTEKSGNIINAALEKSNKQAFIEMLKLIEFGVDEFGKVSMPEIHLPPDSPLLKELQSETESGDFGVEVKALIKQKSELALSKELERLSKFKSKYVG